MTTSEKNCGATVIKQLYGDYESMRRASTKPKIPCNLDALARKHISMKERETPASLVRQMPERVVSVVEKQYLGMRSPAFIEM